MALQTLRFRGSMVGLRATLMSRRRPRGRPRIIRGQGGSPFLYLSVRRRADASEGWLECNSEVSCPLASSSSSRPRVAITR